MKLYELKNENSVVSALILIEAKEMACFATEEDAITAAINAVEGKERIGKFIFTRILEMDRQEDGALMFSFETAIKPTIKLGTYKGVTVKTPKDSPDFETAAIEAATDNTEVTVPGIIVERKLDGMETQQKSDVMQSVPFNTLADVYAIVHSMNDNLDVPEDPDTVFAKAFEITKLYMDAGESQRNAGYLINAIIEVFFNGEDAGETWMNIIEEALDRRIDARDRMSGEEIAEDVFAVYLKSRKQTLEQWREEHSRTAAELVRTELMLDAVAEAEDMAVTNEELHQGIADMAAQYQISPDEVIAAAGEEAIRYQMLRAKARKLIADNAVSA